MCEMFLNEKLEENMKICKTLMALENIFFGIFLETYRLRCSHLTVREMRVLVLDFLTKKIDTYINPKDGGI